MKGLNDNFRVLSNKVNGLITAHEGGELLEELTVSKELQPVVTCLQETNKNWKSCGIYHSIKTILNKVWRKSKLITYNSPEYTPSATLICDKWVSQFRLSRTNNMLETTIEATENKRLQSPRSTQGSSAGFFSIC
eukprot:3733987-Ditylum_brightwellii.AAC.1